jgi:transcription initiation factor TFIIH subunit 1
MKLSEEDFWRRYFQSKLFNAHRASIRSSASQHVVKDDPILDKYLEKDDDGACRLMSGNPFSSFVVSLELEPRRQRTDGVELFVDLGATLEDHGEVISICRYFTDDS